jgi:hypothetical protein
MEVSSYNLRRADGSHIRVATQVSHNGRVIQFLDRLPKGEAIRQAAKRIRLDELVAGFGAGEVEKYEFYAATMDYPAAEVASAADIDIEVVLDRRRYLGLAQQSKGDRNG